MNKLPGVKKFVSRNKLPRVKKLVFRSKLGQVACLHKQVLDNKLVAKMRSSWVHGHGQGQTEGHHSESHLEVTIQS